MSQVLDRNEVKSHYEKGVQNTGSLHPFMIAILQIFIPYISFPYLKIQMSDISMHLFHSILTSVCQSTGIYLSVLLHVSQIVHPSFN